MFAQQELDSCWVLLFIDRWAHTRHSSPELTHLHVCLTKQTCRLFRISTPLPRLQVLVGAFSPHARSQTPAWCLFRRRWAERAAPWGVCSTRHPDFHFGLPHARSIFVSGEGRMSRITAYGVSVQPETLFSLLSPPPLSAKAMRRLFRSCRGSILCMWLSYKWDAVCRIATAARKPSGMSV